MTMTNTELIRTEIERRLKLYKGLTEYTVNPNRIDELEQLLDFINSLPEEKHERLPNINCVWYKDGKCKNPKGLPGTKCDVVGCVAYISKAESVLIEKRGRRVI